MTSSIEPMQQPTPTATAPPSTDAAAKTAEGTLGHDGNGIDPSDVVRLLLLDPSLLAHVLAMQPPSASSPQEMMAPVQQALLGQYEKARGSCALENLLQIAGNEATLRKMSATRELLSSNKSAADRSSEPKTATSGDSNLELLSSVSAMEPLVDTSVKQDGSIAPSSSLLLAALRSAHKSCQSSCDEGGPPAAQDAPQRETSQAETAPVSTVGVQPLMSSCEADAVVSSPPPAPASAIVGLRRKTSREQFPERLYRVLQEIEQEGRDDIISFVNHGTAFEIHQPEEFQETVIPRYFRQCGLGSFKKQLNLYGFRRLKEDSRGFATTMVFYHPQFQQGKPELCLLMNRSKQTKKPKRPAVSPTTTVCESSNA